jgi:hypothetical protein
MFFVKLVECDVMFRVKMFQLAHFHAEHYQPMNYA